jgi:predicted 3-demethylubiquinone-9 3-methyltransferase (glyoxalase superfamily)
MQKITPFLWFDTQAEEATNFYVSVFKSSRIVRVLRYGDAGPRPKGSVMTVDFVLDGQELVALTSDAPDAQARDCHARACVQGKVGILGSERIRA